LNIHVFLFRGRHLGTFSMFGHKGAPTKGGGVQATECRIAVRHFLAYKKYVATFKSSHGAAQPSLAQIHGTFLYIWAYCQIAYRMYWGDPHQIFFTE